MGLFLLGPGLSGPVWATQAQAPVTRTVVLRPIRASYLRIDFDYESAGVLPPFTNEPALAGKRIARVLIPTVPPTPVLRNYTDDELYLKPDHNQDLSRGPCVTYKGRYDPYGHVLFDDLRVCTEQGALAIPYALRMGTYKTVCRGWFEVQSAWSGPFDLDGQSWTLAIVDNLDGRIDDHDLLSLSTQKGTQEVLFAHECPVPRTLFFAGHTFRLDFAFKSLPPEVVLEATLTEIRPTLGQLDVQAAGCTHLRLRDGQQIVLLSCPAGTVSVPAGNYQVDQCLLAHGVGGRVAPKFVSCDHRVSVHPGPTTPLRLGAPLTNSVEVSRDGNLLHLKHQLTGVGGERYECGRDPVPSYAIYKGPLKIAGGTFPFG